MNSLFCLKITKMFYLECCICTTRFLIYVILFLPKNVHLTFIAAVMKSFIFCLSEKALFILHFWNLISLDNEFYVDGFLFQQFKCLNPLSSCFHGFWQEVYHSFYACTFIGNIHSILPSPHGFFRVFLCFWFSAVLMWYIEV